MADIAKIVEDLSTLTVLEAAELAKALEEAWGVSAAAAVAVAGPAAAAGWSRPALPGLAGAVLRERDEHPANPGRRLSL